MESTHMSLLLCMLLMLVVASANGYTGLNHTPTCMASYLALCSELQGYRPRNCRDLQIRGDTGRGVRQIFPFRYNPKEPVSVYCDHTVDGGGWTVFQRRTNLTVREDFYRTWIEYQLGFGKLEGEFWLGLDSLHALTSSSLQELRVDLADYEGNIRWAKYGVFHVDTSKTFYRLSIGRYSGNAGDGYGLHNHNRMKFSTHDADHDTNNVENCAQKYRGASWYSSCHNVNLNGYQYEGNMTTHADGIHWGVWKGHDYSLMNTTLMIRPAFLQDNWP